MIAQAWTAYAAWTAVLVAATGLCGLYCGLETGVYVLNKIRLDLHREAGSRRARRLRRLLARPDSLLAVLLIGTNVTSYAATFAVTTMFVLAGAGEAAEWYALAVATPVLFVFGDSVPKNVFQRLAETLTYRLSWLLAATKVLFTVTGLSPLVRGAAWLIMLPIRRRRDVSHEQLAAIFAEGHAGGALTHTQSVMVDRVLNISDVTLADVMVPMGQAVTVRSDVTREQLLPAVRQSDFSRLPVLDAAGAVVGVLDIYDALADESPTPPADRMTPPFELPERLAVTEALYRMQRAHRHMAVVVAAGRPVGIVTIKDLVEEIVGELEEW